MAQIAWASMRPHVKNPIPPSDFLLFPDDRHDLPDDVDEQELAWMLALKRREEP